MHKVININIGGRIFHLEENAFEALSEYINSLKKYFGDKPEGSEIVADIENRIAELLEQKLKDKTNITVEDVMEIVTSMGSPKAIAGDEEESTGEKETKAKTETYRDYNSGRSKIYRDPDGKVIGGVCSGLAHYFDMDSTIVRLIFVALFFAGGSSVFLYLILLIVIPEARTTAEKLAMRKEKINVDTIRRSVEEEFDRVKGSIAKGNYQGRISSVFQKIFHVIGLIVRAFFKFLGLFFGVIFAIVTLSLFIGLFSVIIGSSALNGFHFGIFDHTFISFFDNANDRLLSQVAIVSCLFALILIFLNISRSLLTSGADFANRKFFNRITFTITLLAIILVMISAAKTVSYFRSEASVENVIPLDSTNKFYTVKTFRNRHHGMHFIVENDSLKIRDVELRIEYTEGLPELIQVIESRGQNMNKAKMNASNCSFDLQIKDSVITLPESFILKNDQAYRKQKLIFILRLPADSKFMVDRSSNLDINSQTSNYDEVGDGETYLVKEDGLHCLDCNDLNLGSAGIENSEYDFNYQVSDFNVINVESKLKIRIIKGDFTKVMAKGIDNKSDLIVKMDEGGLDIRMKHSLFSELDNDAEVIVMTPYLNNLRISGAVKAEVEGFENEKMTIHCSGASSCVATISSVVLTSEVSGASELMIKGMINKFYLDVAGASKVDASDAMAQEVNVVSSGASSVKVYASRSLKARSSGASKIVYYGNPVTTDCTSTGAGKIIKK